jgi:ABC-type antimicrobial peptide transport system permease subunit
VPDVRRVVADLDPGLALASVMTMPAMVSGSLATERFLTTLMSAFAMVAMTLAVIGLYGVVAYGVGLRRHEMGIRVALGARPQAIRRLVVGGSIALVGGGAVLGVIGALAATRLLSGLLYGVGTTDPATFIAVVVALLAAGYVAAAIPAWRAARVDPVEVLNRE